jgi:formate dehydrogenase (NADP+) beta subunit
VPVKYPDRRVAIIGSGPCGLTAARDLVEAGYPVTVLEAMPVAGGMLRLGVPEYRLPAEMIEREVQDILDLGVELRLNYQVENLDDLFEEGFEAVLMAVGAHEGVRLPIPGASLEGVLINTHFLRDVRLGKYTQSEISGNGDAPPELGENVLVLGGGNVAIDVARTRCSARAKGFVWPSLRAGEGMPSHDWEVQAALDEGIRLYPSRTFERIVPNGDGKASGVECMNVRNFSFDETGRLNVDKEPGSKPRDPLRYSHLLSGTASGPGVHPGRRRGGYDGQTYHCDQPQHLCRHPARRVCCGRQRIRHSFRD